MRRTTPTSGAVLSPWFLPAAVGLIAFFVFVLMLMGFLERPLAVRLAGLLPYVLFLLVAVAVWALVASRLVLDVATGAGFAVASLGLLLRLLVVLEAIVDIWLRRQGVANEPLTVLHVAADLLGTFAYVFGLAMVVVSVVLERRRRTIDRRSA